MKHLWLLLLAWTACSLDERSDYLIGRQCRPDDPEQSCDPLQACLPHRQSDRGLENFRCRDKASFEPIAGEEPPLAYCNDQHLCPPGVECRPDRLRVDIMIRPLVCKLPGDVFSPPADGGP